MWPVYRGHRRAALLEGALQASTASGFALEFIARQGLPGELSLSLVWLCAGLDVLGDRLWAVPALFDNFIGRKRNVGGGVLAAWHWLGIVLRHGEDCTDGHVSRFIALPVWFSGWAWGGCVWDSSRRLAFGLDGIVISRVWVFELSTT